MSRGSGATKRGDVDRRRIDGSTPRGRRCSARSPRRDRAGRHQHADAARAMRSISGSTLSSSPTLAPCSHISGPSGRAMRLSPRRSGRRCAMFLAALARAPAARGANGAAARTAAGRPARPAAAAATSALPPGFVRRVVVGARRRPVELALDLLPRRLQRIVVGVGGTRIGPSATMPIRPNGRLMAARSQLLSSIRRLVPSPPDRSAGRRSAPASRCRGRRRARPWARRRSARYCSLLEGLSISCERGDAAFAVKLAVVRARAADRADARAFQRRRALISPSRWREISTLARCAGVA